MAAPASAAPIAASAISWPVTGRCGDIDGRVDRAGDGAGDDDFAFGCHGDALSYDPMSLRALRLCAASAISRRSRQIWRSLQLGPPAALARRSRSTVSMHLAGPVDAALHLREEARVDLLVALDIVAHAARRIEVDGLERTHEGPAQRQAVADADIDILDRGIAVGDQAERLLEQRALQAVHDEAVELALHHDRRLAGGDQEGAGALDDGRDRSRAPARPRPPG